MFWDRVAWVYDVFANGINRRANRAMCAAVAAHSLTAQSKPMACATRVSRADSMIRTMGGMALAPRGTQADVFRREA